MDNRESPVSSSSIPQFRLVDLKLPPLNDQNIKEQVEETHRESHSLVLRQPLLGSISRILRPTTNFIDSVLLEKKECGNEVELDATNILELNSMLSELDALLGDSGFSTRALLERQERNTRNESIDSEIMEFSLITELKSLAEDGYFLYPTLLMEKSTINAVQRFDEIDPHMASMELLEFLSGLSRDAKMEKTANNVVQTLLKFLSSLSRDAKMEKTANNVVKTLLEFLSSLSWDAKAINTIGCFIFKFLEFLGFLLHGPNQPLAEIVSSMATLKESPISLLGSPLEQILVPLDQLNNLIKLTLEVIEYISVLALLSDTEYDKKDLLSSCGYWTILSVVTCYIQTAIIMQNGEMALDLSNLISSLSHIMNDLKHHYTICKPQIEEMETHLQHIAVLEDAFREGKQSSDTPIDMSKLMKSFMYSKDNCHSLIDGSTMFEVDLEIFKEKAVIFIISDLNIDSKQFAFVYELHKELKEEDYYKIVWVPFVLKWNEELKQKFEDLKSKMPCYIVSYNSPIAGVWYFKGRQIFFKLNLSYLIIDLHNGNQHPSSNPNCRECLHIIEAEHSPFKQVLIGGIVYHSALSSVSMVYKVPSEEGVNKKKPSSGFQGLVAMSKSKRNLTDVKQEGPNTPQASNVQEATSRDLKLLKNTK